MWVGESNQKKLETNNRYQVDSARFSMYSIITTTLQVCFTRSSVGHGHAQKLPNHSQQLLHCIRICLPTQNPLFSSSFWFDHMSDEISISLFFWSLWGHLYWVKQRLLCQVPSFFSLLKCRGITCIDSYRMPNWSTHRSTLTWLLLSSCLHLPLGIVQNK